MPGIALFFDLVSILVLMDSRVKTKTGGSSVHLPREVSILVLMDSRVKTMKNVAFLNLIEKIQSLF